MRWGLCFIFLFTLFGETLLAQSDRRGLTPKLNTAPENISDSTLYQDSLKISANRTTAYRLTDKLGERYIAPMDTMRLNYSNSVLIDGRGMAVSYLANIASPAQSRIFSERGEGNDFIFTDAYKYYITTPQNALFYDVKDPHTRLNYARSGGPMTREEMFNGVLTTNFGKKINIGVDFDYTSSHGHYSSNGNNLIYYRFFGNYLSDRYEMHSYFRNYNHITSENGGMTNDRYVTHPDDFIEGKRPTNDRKSYPTLYTDTWNRIKGKQFFLSHRYNLGFYRELTTREKEEAERKKEEKRQRDERRQQEALEHSHSHDEDADEHMHQAGVAGLPEEPEDDLAYEIEAVFVPVSSLIHTFEYEGNSRRFIHDQKDPYFRNMDSVYIKKYDSPVFAHPDSVLNDFTEAWNIKNTVALSLREGFQDWAKFGFTAYVNFENRRFTLPGDSLYGTIQYNEFSTYLGAELSKTQGKLLTYNARGEFCLVGTDLGEFRLSGELITRFRLLGKNAQIKANGYIKNLTPAFYARNHHSRYFWWDNSNFRNTQRVFAGGEVSTEQTRTKASAGVESIQNFIYFGKKGVPEQFESNLQVVTARVKQDFRYKVFGWENEIAYQLSSDKDVLPLPLISAYSNIYIDFIYAKVLNIQLGADVHYFTSYYAPYYEPATQQFQNQDEKKIGNYPIINAYANFNLKQARFFVSAYNLSSLFIKPTEYFSLLHYPLNPMTLKLGVSFYLNN